MRNYQDAIEKGVNDVITTISNEVKEELENMLYSCEIISGTNDLEVIKRHNSTMIANLKELINKFI